MISKTAIETYRNRSLRDLDSHKGIPVKELDENLEFLGWEFFTEPLDHQKLAVLLGFDMEQMLLFFDMGTGKTKVVLDLTRFLIKQYHKVRRALVLVPTSFLVYSWIAEAKKHTPDLKVSALLGENDRWAVEADMIISTYAGVVATLADRSSGKGVIDKDKASRFLSQFDLIAYDESTHIKNHRTLSFKVAKIAAKCVDYRYALTGTPFGRDPQDLWSQFFAVDSGETLGSTLGIFRAAFFTEKKSYWGGYEYKFKTEEASNLGSVLRNRALCYSADECMDLPDIIRVQYPILLAADQRAYYQQALEGWVTMRREGTQLEIKNIFVRLRQITSGFLPVKVDGVTTIIDFDNPRLEALVDLVDEVPKTRKVVIFNEFIHSGDLIESRLKANKVRSLRVYGKTKRKEKVIERFNTDSKYRVLIVNSQSGALGLNLQVASYVIFYETPVSPIVRQQAEKRCHRIGQESKVFFYDLFVQDSIDEKIMIYLKEGKDLLEALLKGESKDLSRT